MNLRRSKRFAALLDNRLRDVRYACRSLWRVPLAAMTVVMTLGLGLGLVAAVFAILNAFVFHADEVRNPHELFAVARQPAALAEPMAFTRLEYEALVRETAVFSDTFASTSDLAAFVDGVRREGALVTGNFFEALGVGAVRGRTLTPADDEPGAPAAIVLSHRAWTQHFDGNPGIIGSTLRVNGATFDVVGVMPEGFRGLRPFAAPDFWAPVSLLREFRPANPASVGLDVVGRLKPGLTRDQALAQLRTWDSMRSVDRSVERPALVLEPRQGTAPLSADVLVIVVPLFFAFGLILMIGCANVANLMLARGLARQREIGIRLAMGAARRRVVWQLLTESLLLAVLAAALAFGVSRLVLASLVYAVTSTFPPELGDIRLEMPPADARIALFLIVGAAVLPLFFALEPALRATRLELVRTIHGEVVSGVRPGRARNALVALQVTGSVLLLICAAVFLRSTLAAAAIEPGIRTEDILTVNILDETRRGTILEAVSREPFVTSVAASSPGVPGRFPAFADTASGRSAATFQLVSPEYFDVLGIDVLRGRGFALAERGAAETVAIVSESAAAELWPDTDAVGQVVRVESDSARAQPEAGGTPPPLSRNFVVVGVTRDVPGFRLGGFRLSGAGIYIPISTEAERTSLTLRVRGDAERAQRALVDRLAAIDPNMAQVSALRTFARAEAYLLGIPFWLSLVLGALALFLTLSGLFSVLSYVVEQRTREFGVRTALGATRARIGALVLSQSARPVAIGLLLGAGLPAALGGALLATPAAETIRSTVRLLDPIAYASGLLTVVAACGCAALIPALRASRGDPVAALRRD